MVSTKKPKKDGAIDVHAEGTVIEDSTKFARLPLSVLAIVADVQPDDTTGLETPTLVPCFCRCLPQLEACESIAESSLIVSANTNLSIVQFYDVASLRNAHQTCNPDLLETVEFETPDAIDHDEWRDKLIVPLLHRALYLDPV